jgi:hypothetical protein
MVTSLESLLLQLQAMNYLINELFFQFPYLCGCGNRSLQKVAGGHKAQGIREVYLMNYQVFALRAIVTATLAWFK